MPKPWLEAKAPPRRHGCCTLGGGGRGLATWYHPVGQQVHRGGKRQARAFTGRHPARGGDRRHWGSPLGPDAGGSGLVSRFVGHLVMRTSVRCSLLPFTERATRHRAHVRAARLAAEALGGTPVLPPPPAANAAVLPVHPAFVSSPDNVAGAQLDDTVLQSRVVRGSIHPALVAAPAKATKPQQMT